MQKFNHKRRDEFLSDGEWYFSWWLDDLKKFGYVDDWSYEEETFDLSFPYKLPWEKQLRTKLKPMEHKILEKCTYTPDFKIVWNDSAKGVWFHNIGDKIVDAKKIPYFYAQENLTRIEIKPNHDFQNKTQQAVIKIKWLMQLGTWCQLVIPSATVSKFGKLNPSGALFHNTFVPERYLYTDKLTKLRKINYEFVTLKEWEDTRQRICQTKKDQNST